MKKNAFLLLIVLMIGSVIGYFVYESYLSVDSRGKIQAAFADYSKGETAKTIGDREDAFNRALSTYSELEETHKPIFGNGKLYYNIANSYFQVGEYPFAALYYYRALQLMPQNEAIKSNLAVTLKKLGIQQKKEEGVFQNIFFFHFNYSLPERLWLFFLLSLGIIVFGSFSIWNRSNRMQKIAQVFALLAVVVLISIGYSQYFSPIEAVLVKASGLYRDAGYQYTKVQEEPILSGEKLEVLEIVEEGSWFKVITPEGDLGYVPQEAVRII